LLRRPRRDSVGHPILEGTGAFTPEIPLEATAIKSATLSRRSARIVGLTAAVSLVGVSLVSATAANANHAAAHVQIPITSASPSTDLTFNGGVGVQASYSFVPTDGYVEVQVERDGAQNYAPLASGLGTLRLVQTGLYTPIGLGQTGPGLDTNICVDISQLTDTSTAEVLLLDYLANEWLSVVFVEQGTNVYCADVAGPRATVVVAVPLLGVDPADIDLQVTRVATPLAFSHGCFRRRSAERGTPEHSCDEQQCATAHARHRC